MAQSPDSVSSIEYALTKIGLINFGPFSMDDGSIGLVIGNAGPEMWEVFSQSTEYSDGLKDPLNRWTQRVLSGIAKSTDSTCVYPFDKPFPPFQKFARAATGVKASPLGLLIHPEYGLWHAFRGVLVFGREHSLFSQLSDVNQQVHNLIHPCDTCYEKPCLSACPVGAFSGEGLNVDACFRHLDAAEYPKCVSSGCNARSACPVGQGYKYAPEQLKFHMKIYRGA